MAAEHALLHAQLLHLLQNFGGGTDVGPKYDGVDTGIFDDLKLPAEVHVARHELLLDHYRMAETAGRIAELDNSEAPVAVVHAQQGDALESKLCVNVTREGVALQAVVLN